MKFNAFIFIAIIGFASASVAGGEPPNQVKTVKMGNETFLLQAKECLGNQERTWNVHSWGFDYQWEACVGKLLQNNLTWEKEKKSVSTWPHLDIANGLRKRDFRAVRNVLKPKT